MGNSKVVLELLLSFCVLFLGLSEAVEHSKDLTKCRQVCYQKVGCSSLLWTCCKSRKKAGLIIILIALKLFMCIANEEDCGFTVVFESF